MPKPPRGTCTACEETFVITAKGIRHHLDRAGTGRACRGAFKPPALEGAVVQVDVSSWNALHQFKYVQRSVYAMARTASWGIPLLDPIPVPGHANQKDWGNTTKGSLEAVGRNHPRAGAWLISRYARVGCVAGDPMIGVGGLWLAQRSRVGLLCGSEVEPELVTLAQENLAQACGEQQEQQALSLRENRIAVADAREWKPGVWLEFVLSSPPFRQNHTAGATENQQRIRRQKNLHSMQAFGKSPGNLTREKGAAFWEAMAQVYANTRSLMALGAHALFVLKNHVRNGQEVDEVGLHLEAMRRGGLEILGAHPRELWPTGYVQMRWKKDNVPPEERVWISLEWSVVTRRQN